MRLALVSEDFVHSLPPEAAPVFIELPADFSPLFWESLRESLDKATKILGNDLVADADRLAQLLVELATPSPDLVRERIARRKTVEMLLSATEWFTTGQLQELQPGYTRTVTDWKRRGRVFCVPGPQGQDLYPAYQFDASLQPLPIIRTILQAFGPVADTWILAAWFHFPNGWLAAKDDPERPQAPKDRLDDEAAIVHAARMRDRSYVA